MFSHLPWERKLKWEVRSGGWGQKTLAVYSGDFYSESDLVLHGGLAEGPEREEQWSCCRSCPQAHPRGSFSRGRPPPFSSLQHKARTNAATRWFVDIFDERFYDPKGCYWNSQPFLP